MVSGSVSFLIFSEDGDVLSRSELSASGDFKGLEIPANCWHAVVPGEESAVFFEVKPGPYTVMDDKDFAAWAPDEGNKTVPQFLAALKTIKVGESARLESLIK